MERVKKYKFYEEITKRKTNPSVGRRGLSGAIIEGIFASNASLVGVMDCDLQHDESKLLEMLVLFKNNTSLDLVIGSRFTDDGEISYGAFSKLKRSS